MKIPGLSLARLLGYRNWAVAGGLVVLFQTLQRAYITNRDAVHTSELWSDLSIALFRQDDKKNQHWLWVKWTTNGNGIRDLINTQQGTSSERNVDQIIEGNCSDSETEVPPVSKTKVLKIEVERRAHRQKPEDRQRTCL